ncbi:hypothetical protein HJG60_008708 [Phyllostomus discolor]|uniref:Uncharacterized protein n=1 Tax=Phyllostomus discolor TaxID=89673 RepID=A0A833YT67_9CHIR|nr:hypothetical protein HJG60_008708 [Phyllostomus discolor]
MRDFNYLMKRPSSLNADSRVQINYEVWTLSKKLPKGGLLEVNWAQNCNKTKQNKNKASNHFCTRLSHSRKLHFMEKPAPNRPPALRSCHWSPLFQSSLCTPAPALGLKLSPSSGSRAATSSSASSQVNREGRYLLGQSNRKDLESSFALGWASQRPGVGTSAHTYKSALQWLWGHIFLYTKDKVAFPQLKLKH